jgi:predicted ABC-type ATPase
MSPFSPESAAIRAGRLMLEEIELSMKREADFGFETTLSGRSHLGVIRRLKQHAYQVHLFYLWIPSVELGLARIRERVLRGGHDIPEAVVRRRFDRSITNFLGQYRLQADHGFCLTTPSQPSRLLPLRNKASFAYSKLSDTMS